MQAASCAISFSSLVRRKAAKEGTLRRGRFRFLPLLRTSLIETAKGACGPPLDSPGSGGKTVRVCYRLHHAAPSEASPRGNRGDSLFHDCTKVLGQSPELRGGSLNTCLQETRVEAPFSLWSPRTVSLFGQVPKREMGLDLRSLPPAYRTRKTDCHGSVRTGSQ